MKEVEKPVEPVVEVKPEKRGYFKKTAVATYVCNACGNTYQIESKEAVPQGGMLCAQDLSLMVAKIVVQ